MILLEFGFGNLDIMWLSVKIVYETFRGVLDVWNEGASELVLFRIPDLWSVMKYRLYINKK